MDEEIIIIDSKTRNEKILNFFINNKKKIIIGILILIVVVIGFFSLEKIKERNAIKLANQFNHAIINYKTEERQKTIDTLTELVNENNATYSPLALYFLIDNNLLDKKDEINNLFNELINKTNLQEEIKNLIIYKKALFNSDTATENDLLKTLNPIINSESIWKSHSLYLLAEYFYAKNQNQKAKEFFNQILLLQNANKNIKIESQKRINRDFSE